MSSPERSKRRPSGNEAPAWLVLLHQIPAEPAYLRVKVLRRLKVLGAIAVKSSAYLLPENAEALEDFQWLRREILDGGGEAMIAQCRFLQGISDGELRQRFRARADAEYLELAQAATSFAAAEAPGPGDLERLERRLAKIRARDPFEAPGRAEAELSLRDLHDRIHRQREEESAPMQTRPKAATWVTREGVHVDRMASAWLIRHFIDPQARFKFVSPEGYEPTEGELRFDMFEGEFTHEGEDCTFETLLRRFELDEPALRSIAEVVHDIDCKDDKYARPEAAGISLVIDGISARHADDRLRIEAAAELLDGLHAHLRGQGS